MPENTFNFPALQAIALLLAMPFAQAAWAQLPGGEKTLQREVDPVVISADRLPGLTGLDIAGIRVFAFRDDRAAVIPFQVDQRSRDGDWVWDVVYRRWHDREEEGFHVPEVRKAVEHGRGTVDDGDPAGRAVLDGNDELVLMAKDLGDRRQAPGGIAGASLILEIEVTDTVNDRRGWAYVAHFGQELHPLSGTRYMRYDRQDSRIHSPIYTFRVSDDHPALITDLRINDFPIVDRIKVQGEVTLALPLPAREIRFSEEDIHGYTEGYIEGPVRIIKRNITHLSLSGDMFRTRDLTCDHYYYARHAEIPVCLSIRFPVREIAMTLTTDYRDPPFHRLYMGEAKDPMQTRDRRYSSGPRMHQLGTEWIALDSHEASLISLMVLPDGLDGHAHTRPCLCRGQLKPGQTGMSPGEKTEAGFLITATSGCPKGEHVLYGSYVVSAQPYYPGDEEVALAMQYNRLTARVSVVQPAE